MQFLRVAATVGRLDRHFPLAALTGVGALIWGGCLPPPPSALVYAPRVAPAAPRADLNPSNMFRNAARVKVRSRRYQALRVGSQSGARHRGFLAFSGVLQSNPVQIRSRDVRIFDLRPCGGMYTRLRP